MATINGSCSLGRGYSFYITADVSGRGSSATVTVKSYITNGSKRFSSSGWNFSCTVGSKTQNSSSGIKIDSRGANFNATYGPLTFNTSSGTSTAFTFSNVGIGNVSVSYRIWKSSYSSYDPGEMSASGTIYIAPDTASFNLNILNPDGSEPYTTGEAGTVEQSINGGGYSRVYNESASSYNVGTTFNYRSFSPGTGRYLSSVSGVSPNNTWGPWSATLGSGGLSVNFRTAWNVYTIGYNANGGSSTPSSQTCAHGSSINLAGAINRSNSSYNSNIGITVGYNANGGSNTPSNSTGTAVNTTTTTYNFENWHLNGVNGTAYAAGASYSPSSNVTMYAGWNSSSSTNRTSNPNITLAGGIARNDSTISSYTVAYDANGGSNTPLTQTATRTRRYTFSKWNTNTEGTGTDYNPNTAYTFSSNTTLYAKWGSSDSGGNVTLANAISRDNSILSSYVVSYNANGGSSTPDDQTAIKIRAYTFNKWADGSVSGTQYAAGVEYTPSANTTMYATWNTSDSGGSITLPAAISRTNGATVGYSITYNANGGSGAPGNQTSDNRTITYSFNKWAAGSTSGTQYAAGASYTPSANTTMYALWNSSTSNNSSWTCSNVKPTRTGYTFLGWSETAGANTAQYQAGQTYTITGAKTLYAVWQVNFYYIDVNGLLDGVETGNITDFGKYDVYIDGVQIATQVTDYCVEWPYGTQYEIKNITPDWGVKYNGVTTGSLSGTLGAARVNIQLSFTRLPVTLKANVNNEWKIGIVYVNVDGEWKKARALNVHHDGDWERLEKVDFTV